MSLRSDNVTKGAERAPNRSLFYAMGYTKEELERPLIGVISAHSEIVPGHMHLDKIADPHAQLPNRFHFYDPDPVLVGRVQLLSGVRR